LFFRRSKFLLGRRKYLLSSVEGFAKAGDGTKMDFFTGVNGDNRDELKTLFPLFSPVRKGFFAILASWRDEFFI
jgi:hypothetical protein